MKIKSSKNLPEALILALADPVKEAKLRSICYRLKEKGNTLDYSTNKEVPFLDFVTYGIGGIKLSKVSALIN